MPDVETSSGLDQAPAWAKAIVARLDAIDIAAAAAAAAAGYKPVIDGDTVDFLISKKSEGARRRWLSKWAPKAMLDDGRYSYAAIKRGLEAEARG